MIEGTSRTAFTCNFFAKRALLFASDASLEKWFDDANTLATKDRKTALWIAASWLIHPLKHIDRLLKIKNDPQLARQEMLWVAWTLAAIEIIKRGEIWEEEIIYRGLEYNPELFKAVYTNVQSGSADEGRVRVALERTHKELKQHGEEWLKPMIDALRKKRRLTSLSELADDFAHTQIYPWHIQTSCEWLSEQGIINAFSAPFRLTKRSSVELEEPAYELQDA